MIRDGFSPRRLVSVFLVLMGNVIYALSVKLFLLPAQLMSCGTTGIGLVVNRLTGCSLPGFILLFNLAALILGWRILGGKFALSTVFSSLFYPVALEVLHRLLGDYQMTGDTLLNVIFAGLGSGLGLGMVIRGGASTGGMDIPPLILQKFFRIPVSFSLWAFDICILLAQTFFHTPEDLLYGVMLTIVTSLSLNKVLLLGTSKTEVKIVSTEAAKIRDGILSQVDRGVTVLHGEGGYLRQPSQILLSVVSNHELPRIEHLARSIDPECFIIVSRVCEVWGKGFSRGKHQGRHAKDPRPGC